MTPSKARALLSLFISKEATDAFDPLWPETMLGLDHGASPAQVLAGLQARLDQINQSSYADTYDAQLLRDALQSVAAQMINGPGATWSVDLWLLRVQDPSLAAHAQSNESSVNTAQDQNAFWRIDQQPQVCEHDQPLAQAQQDSPELQDLTDLARALFFAGKQPLQIISFLASRAQELGLDPGIAPSLLQQALVSSAPSAQASPAAVHAHQDSSRAQSQPNQPAFSRDDQSEHVDQTSALAEYLTTYNAPRSRALAATLWSVAGLSVVASAAYIAGILLQRSNTPRSADALESSSSAGSQGSAPSGSPSPSTWPNAPANSSSANSDPRNAPNLTSSPSAQLPAVSVLDLRPDEAVLVRQFKDATDAGNVADIAQLISVFRRWWPGISAGAQVAIVETIVQATYSTATNPTNAASLLSAIGLTGSTLTLREVSDIPERIATIGIVSRLRRERDLPPPFASQLDRRLAALPALDADRANRGLRFDDATRAALADLVLPVVKLSNAATQSSLPETAPTPNLRLARSAAEAWLDSLRGSTSGRTDAQSAQQTIILQAIEQVLVRGPELVDDRAAQTVVSLWLTACTFEPRSPARSRIVAWIADPRISPSDASVVMQILATSSSAPGLSRANIPPITASAQDREEFSNLLAELWDVSIAPGSSPVTLWFLRVKESLASSKNATSELRKIAYASQLSLFHASAIAAFRGQPSEPPAAEPPASTGTAVLTPSGPGPIAPSNFLPPPTAPGTNAGGSDGVPVGDGLWARQFMFEARTAAAKVARARDAANLSNIGPIDAGVLAEITLSASGELRAAAQQSAAKHMDNPVMISALAEAFARSARSARNVLFLAQMAGTATVSSTSPRYVAHFRRAFAEKYLWLVARVSDVAEADAHAQVFATAYAAIADSPAAASIAEGQLSESQPIESGQAALLAVEQACIWYVDQARRASLAIDLPSLQRSLDARLKLASGLMQQFAARQLFIAELLTQIVASERPGLAPDAESLLAELRVNHRDAPSIADQILLSEQTIVRLWALRAGERL